MLKGADILWDYMAYGPFADANQMADWMETNEKSTDPLFYTLIDTATNTTFGMASYLNIHPQHGSIEIGHIWIAPGTQRSSLATEAIFVMISHAMDSLKFRRMEWKCHALNAKSRNAAKRFGFSYEGIFYRHIIQKGKNRDTAWFSIIEEEWPVLRRHYQTWLAADNFDQNGRQKQALSKLNWP